MFKKSVGIIARLEDFTRNIFKRICHFAQASGRNFAMVSKRDTSERFFGNLRSIFEQESHRERKHSKVS